MKSKILKTLCIIVAVLFTCTIIGAVVVSIVAPKYDTVSASADTSEPRIRYTTSAYDLTGCYQLRFGAATEYISTTISISNSFMIMANTGEGLSVPCTSGRFYFDANGKLVTFAVTAYINGKFVNTNVYSGSTWNNSFLPYIVLYGDYGTDFANIINKFGTAVVDPAVLDTLKVEAGDAYNSGYGTGYDEGYEEGVPVGYDTGYNDGYADGYQVSFDLGVSKGHSDQITNPIAAFIEPVHKFMNTKFFGNLTYAAIFNTILFVIVATIFIKMFGGG